MEARQPLVRPAGISALAVFFAAGALIALVSAMSLLVPASVLEPMWQLNPRAHSAFVKMRVWAPVLLITLSLACGTTACGLWLGWRWGYRLAVGLLIIQLPGDFINVLLGIEPRAAFGIPIVAVLLWVLGTARVRIFFKPA
jgi:hypothetical protein